MLRNWKDVVKLTPEKYEFTWSFLSLEWFGWYNQSYVFEKKDSLIYYDGKLTQDVLKVIGEYFKDIEPINFTIKDGEFTTIYSYKLDELIHNRGPRLP